MHLGEAILDAAQHLFVPVDLEVGMKAALHEHPRTAKFDGLADLVVDGVEVEDVAVFGGGSLQGAVEGAEGAVLGAEVRVVNIPVDNVGDNALRMKTATHRV